MEEAHSDFSVNNLSEYFSVLKKWGRLTAVQPAVWRRRIEQVSCS